MAQFLSTLQIDTLGRKLLAATALGIAAYGGYKFIFGKRSDFNNSISREPGHVDSYYHGLPAVIIPDT